MDVHSDYPESAMSILSYKNVSFSKAEDSGYQTLTPGSLEISTENIEHPIITNRNLTGSGPINFSHLHFTPEVNIQLSGLYAHSTAHSDALADTPPYRRGCKRSFSSTERTDSFSPSVPTPTTFIAGKIKSLDVNENKENSGLFSQVNSLCSDKFELRVYEHDLEQILSIPTTPVNCKRHCRKTGKTLHVIHSLSCESNELQSTVSQRALSRVARKILLPEQKVDIIQKLYDEAGAMPPIMKIFGYLSNEDIYNFSRVSKTWHKIWNSLSEKNKKKLEYGDYLKTAKENQENRNKGTTIVNYSKHGKGLKEIQNLLNSNPVKITGHITPPASPRTNKFRKFTKAASLDLRVQLSCVRCCQPAKVTEESSGEVWVECTSQSCLYQFCKYCKCNRHPGKFCFQYDLNAPSPSKRKKNLYAIGTKKSRRNLLRL